MKRKQDLVATIILTGFLFSFGFGHSAALGKPPIPQSQLISVGVLSFQDESGMNASSELGQKLGQELQQKLVVAHKNLLPRMISTGTDPGATKDLTIDQLVALGKQNGVKFVVRSGLLAVTSENAAEESKVTVQLYAEVIAVETSNVSSIRAEGVGTPMVGGDINAQLSSVDFKNSNFRSSGLGQAFLSAIEQLAASIYQAITAAQTTQSQATAETGGTSEADAAQAEAAQAAEADAELQQLIAQAEQTLSNSAGGSTENIAALSKALEDLKGALSTKASLLEESKDTAQADQDVAGHKEELQAALTKLTEEAAANASASGGGEQPGGEKKSLLGKISNFAGEALTLLQKIQEMRAALLGLKQEQSGYTGETGAGESAPSEETTEDLSGVVTEDGNPVEGVQVYELQTGLTTTTDSNGSYKLKGLTTSKLTKLVVQKGQKKMNAQIEVFPGRANVADFQFKSATMGMKSPSSTVLPSTVVIGVASALAGQVKGVVQDAKGHPVSRALVTLKGLASARSIMRDQDVLYMSASMVNLSRANSSENSLMRHFAPAQDSRAARSLGVARTNSLGQYTFLNVPAGLYQLTVNHSSLKTKVLQVQVGQRKIAEANFKFSQTDAIVKLPSTGRSLIQPGAATILRGTVLDNQNQPVSGAKISAVQAESVLSVFTRTNGTFELRNLKPGPYRVTISKVGYEGASQQLTLRSGSPEQRNFQLKKQSSRLIASLLRNESRRRTETMPKSRADETSVGAKTANSGLIAAGPGQLTGRITDAANGKQLSGVSVSLPGQPSTKTDREGNYRFAPLATGNYQVSAKLKGYVTETRRVAVRPGLSARQDIALKLERLENRPSSVIRKPAAILGGAELRRGQIVGLVMDAKTGNPIPSAIVSVTGQRNVPTDQAGRFVISSLAPGTYQISVSKTGFGQSRGSISVRAGETATANFKLSPVVRPPLRTRLP